MGITTSQKTVVCEMYLRYLAEDRRTAGCPNEYSVLPVAFIDTYKYIFIH
jgi:hypothetical protein